MPGPIAHLTTQTHLVTQMNQQGTKGFTMRMEEGGGGARRGGRQQQSATKVVTMVDNRGGGKGRVRRRGEGDGVMAPTKGRKAATMAFDQERKRRWATVDSVRRKEGGVRCSAWTLGRRRSIDSTNDLLKSKERGQVTHQQWRRGRDGETNGYGKQEWSQKGRGRRSERKREQRSKRESSGGATIPIRWRETTGRGQRTKMEGEVERRCVWDSIDGRAEEVKAQDRP